MPLAVLHIRRLGGLLLGDELLIHMPDTSCYDCYDKTPSVFLEWSEHATPHATWSDLSVGSDRKDLQGLRGSNTSRSFRQEGLLSHVPLVVFRALLRWVPRKGRRGQTKRAEEGGPGRTTTGGPAMGIFGPISFFGAILFWEASAVRPVLVSEVYP